jgi:hypothetical protein
MSKQKHQGQISIPGRYVAVRHEILDALAWKVASFGARLLYIALHRRLIYKDNNNGKIFLSTREAAEEIGTRQKSIGILYRELEHYGFIVMTSAGHLGVEGKGRAARWRLTDWRCGKDLDGTKDYLKCDGTLFEKPRRHNRPPSKTRPAKSETRGTPRLRVRHTPPHVPEAHPASGKPESEAHPASCEGGSPEAHPASDLNQPSPPSSGAAEGTAGPAKPQSNGHSSVTAEVMSLLRSRLH